MKRIGRFAFVALLGAMALFLGAARCIENDAVGVDEGGYTHVRGEMVNETDVSADSVTLQATLFDVAGNVLAQATGNPCPTQVQPKSTNAFDIKFTEPVAGVVARHEVRPIAGVTVPDTLPPHKIFPIKWEAARSGPLMLTLGLVRNDSGITYSNMRMCAAFYNNQGKVVFVEDEPILGELTPGKALEYRGVSIGVPAEAVQFRMWLSTGGVSQFVSSNKITIQ